MAATREHADGPSPAATPPGLPPCGLRPDEPPPGWVFPEGWTPAPGPRRAAVDVVPGTPAKRAPRRKSAKQAPAVPAALPEPAIEKPPAAAPLPAADVVPAKPARASRKRPAAPKPAAVPTPADAGAEEAQPPVEAPPPVESPAATVVPAKPARVRKARSAAPKPASARSAKAAAPKPATRPKSRAATPPSAKSAVPTPRPPQPSAPLPHTLIAGTSAPAAAASSHGLTGLVGPAWSPGRTKEARNTGASPIGPRSGPDHGPRTAPLAPAKNDGLAVAALALAVLWLAGVGSLAAVVLGSMSRSKAREAKRLPSGLAKAGVRLGWLGLVAVPLVFLVLLPAYTSSRDASGSGAVKDALREAGLAQEEHLSETGRYADSLPGVEVVRASTSGYCLRATSSSGESWYLDDLRTSPSTSPC